MAPINDNNLVVDYKIEMPTESRVIFDEYRIDSYEPNRAWNHSPNIDGEVDIACARPLCQDPLTNPSTLFGCESDGPRAAATPRLALRVLAGLAIAITLTLLAFTLVILGLPLSLLGLTLLALTRIVLRFPLSLLRLALLPLPPRLTLLVAGSLAWGSLLALFFLRRLLAFLVGLRTRLPLRLALCAAFSARSLLLQPLRCDEHSTG